MQSPTQSPLEKSFFYQFKKNKLAVFALSFLLLFVVVGIYAPLFASSKPLFLIFDGESFFPLLRYLFYPGYYTKPIDLFYNLLMITAPIGILGYFLLKEKKKVFFLLLGFIHLSLFLIILTGFVKDPASNPQLQKERSETLKKRSSFREDPLLAPFPFLPDWDFELKYMPIYEKINLLLRYKQRKAQHMRLLPYTSAYTQKTQREVPTLWEVDHRNAFEEKKRLQESLAANRDTYEKTLNEYPELVAAYRPYSHDFIMAKLSLENTQQQLEKLGSAATAEDQENLKKAQLHYEEALKKASFVRIPLEQARLTLQNYQETSHRLEFIKQKEAWIEKQSQNLKIIIPAFIRQFHWEDDAGGQQSINKYIPWWELSRVNRKDLVAGLLFGIRISLVVGFTAVFLSLLIGIPLGMISGYFVGKTDIVICRLIEIWEAMPTFFMLLLIVAITQSKSIFLVIGTLGIFGWTGLARFMRGEVLKQRNLPYVLSCYSQGFRHPRIMFSHILPNAIPPILTLLPFSMMAAITSEAGISFLGLGEEGSTSWGVLMAEGRSVFPGEGYLLWPPAIFLTLLLICIAIVGDAFRDAIDPKMRQ